MPAVSQAQRGYLNAKFGHGWVKTHHFDNTGPLPPHVKKPKKKPVERADLQRALAQGRPR